MLCVLTILHIVSVDESNAQKKYIESNSTKMEIVQLEKAFQDSLNSKGAAFAFAYFAAPHAVIKRENDTLINGIDAIQNYYSAEIYKKAKAYWKPDFLKISNDGSMAYSYGKYEWKIIKPSGEVVTWKGIYFTVWEKQADGSWKYVWD
jgi:ketosteroid isomerase-like protein